MGTSKNFSRRDFLKATGGAIGATLLASCQSATPQPVATQAVTEPVKQPATQVNLNMWTEPGDGHLAFYDPILKSFKEKNPNITIKYGPIPPAESAEEVILSALATGTAPDLWAGMMNAFATQLSGAGSIVSLDTIPGFQEVIKGRHMEEMITHQKSPDGHNYFIPQFTSLEMYQWNVDMLESLGLDKPPRTYSEFLALGPKVKEKGAFLITSFNPSPTWWRRLEDWYSLYKAATSGGLMFEKGKATFNNPDALKLAQFVQTVFKEGYATTEELNDPFETGRSLAHEFGTWRLSYQAEHFPEFKYVVTPPVVPDDFPADKPITTFGDSKGWSLYAKSKYQSESWEFLKFLWSDEQHDVQFLDIIGHLPFRQDLTTNPAFDNIMKEKPNTKAYAEALPRHVPWEPEPKIISLLDAFSSEFWEPLVTGTKTPEQALADGETAVNKVFSEG